VPIEVVGDIAVVGNIGQRDHPYCEATATVATFGNIERVLNANIIAVWHNNDLLHTRLPQLIDVFWPPLTRTACVCRRCQAQASKPFYVTLALYDVDQTLAL
jgi:hypothetical protein